MKRFQKLALLLISVLFSVGFIACNESTTETTTQAEEVVIEGEYIIDITDLGMPLQFYLKIDAEDNFYLSTDRTFAVDKGHGTIGSSGTTYMMIYSDSTVDEPKTSTFEVEDNNLHFKTTLCYGSSNLPASKVDDNNPDITYYLVAKTLMYEEYFGEYAGNHIVSAMGSEVEYDYYLQIKEGREFYFQSNFEMGGESYEYVEEGFYDLEGSTISLHYENEDITGTFDTEKALTIPIKASEMGSREERTLQIAITAEYAGTYYSYAFSEGAYESSITLVLDKFGNYQYEAVDTINGTVSESGSFVVNQSAIEFTPEGTSTSHTATLSKNVITATFNVSTTDVSHELTLYKHTIQGVFSGTGEDEQENEYVSTLTLNPDGTFEIELKDAADNIIISDSGTFTQTTFMIIQLNLVGAEGVYTCVVSEIGLNINFDMEDETTLGFVLTK